MCFKLPLIYADAIGVEMRMDTRGIALIAAMTGLFGVSLWYVAAGEIAASSQAGARSAATREAISVADRAALHFHEQRAAFHSARSGSGHGPQVSRAWNELELAQSRTRALVRQLLELLPNMEGTRRLARFARWPSRPAV